VSAARRSGLVVAAVALAQVCVTLDYYALTVALPQMADDLGTSTTNLQWALSGYMLAFAALLVAGGRAADVLGRRRVLVAGVAVFGLASLVCGLAQSDVMLIGVRVVQGAGAAFLFPASLAVVAAVFQGDAQARAVGSVVAVATMGSAAGPFVGGVLTDALSWRWIFFLNVPIALATILLALRAIPESRDETASRHVDLAGLLLLSGGVVGLALAVDRAGVWGAGSGLLWGTLAAAVACLGAFVLVEARSRAPLLDLGLLRNRRLVAVAASGCLSNFSFALGVFLATLYLQDARGLSALQAGVAFLAMSGGVVVISKASGTLTQWVGLPVLMGLGTVVGALALAAQSWVDSWGAWLPLFCLFGIGVGLNYALTNQGTLAAVEPRQAGAATGMTLTSLIVIAALATAFGATAVEELASGPGAVAETDAIHQVMRIGAAVSLLGVLPLLPVVRRWPPTRVAAEPAPAAT
jgi:EmrB/QacA subfamily drug resistance transporter